VVTKALPRQPFQAIPLDRGTGMFARDGHTQAGDIAPVRAGQYREKAVFRPLSPTENPLELGSLVQTRFGWEPPGPWHVHQRPPYGVSRARPFARRALSTLRPPLVAMRARKPWVRLRRRLLGWNVLFMTVLPNVSVGARAGCGVSGKPGKVPRGESDVKHSRLWISDAQGYRLRASPGFSVPVFTFFLRWILGVFGE